MSILFTLALGVGVLMGVILAMSWHRWSELDAGQRWIARGLGLFFLLFLIAFPMAIMGRRTRLVQEVPILLGTLCYLAAFASWQTFRATERLIRFGMVVFVGLWIAAQWLQGLQNNFSTISGPIHGTVIMAAGSVTLIAKARVATHRWTAQSWFWIAVGFMLVYGTEVLIDPLHQRIFGLREDLATWAFGFHQVCSILGYLLVLRGFVRPSQVRPGFEAGPTRPLVD